MGAMLRVNTAKTIKHAEIRAKMGQHKHMIEGEIRDGLIKLGQASILLCQVHDGNHMNKMISKTMIHDHHCH